MFLVPVFFCPNPVRQTGPVFPPIIPEVWLPLPNALMPLRCLDPLSPSKSPISDSGGGSHYHSPLRFGFNFKRGTKRDTLTHITGGNSGGSEYGKKFLPKFNSLLLTGHFKN